MRRTILMAALGLMLAALPAAAQQTEHRVEFRPPGEAAAGPPIVLSFQGELYDDASFWFSQLAGRKAGLGAAEAFVLEVVATNRDGEPDDVVGLWSPAAEAEIRASVEDPSLWQRNREMSLRMVDSALRAQVLYGPYILMFVQHSSDAFEDFVSVYPLLEQGGRYYLTNALQADPIYRFFVQYYRERLLIERPE